MTNTQSPILCPKCKQIGFAVGIRAGATVTCGFCGHSFKAKKKDEPLHEPQGPRQEAK
jgi:hypothetical protein